MRGSVENLIALYKRSKDWERTAGEAYYGRQRQRLLERAEQAGLELEPVIAAFCVLSPNNAESTNYLALDVCIAITNGLLPKNSKIPAYPLNRVKALAILSGAPIEDHLSGRKVTSFYYNTLNPDSSANVTVDGHMLGAWCNRRFTLRRDAGIPASEYPIICDHFREAAQCFNLSAPKFQAILWLTWKRINRILFSGQLQFELDGHPLRASMIHGLSLSSLISYQQEGGRLKRQKGAQQGICDTIQEPMFMELGAEHAPIAL